MKTIFHNFTLIDGTGNPPQENALLEIQSSKITYAGQDLGYAQTDSKTIKVDLGGRFMIPGLIDTHVHLSGSGEPDSHFMAPDPEMLLIMLKNAQRNLAAGITTVRDVGGWNELEFALRKAIQKGDQVGSRLVLAGRFISITEAGAPYYAGMYREADGVDDVRKAVREQIKHGADLIKFGVTGAVLVEDGAPGATHFNRDEMVAGVQEAKKFGKRVSAHAHGVEGIRLAVESGADSIEHGTFLHQDPDLIRLMAEKGVFLVPTLQAGWAVIEDKKHQIPNWIIEKSLPIQEDAVMSLVLAYKAGVPIAMGSDAATPLNYHGENALEIYWMQQAGMSAMDALVAATGNAARALGCEGSLGTLQVGKIADLVVLNTNPLTNLRSLADKNEIYFVMKDGLIASANKDINLTGKLCANQVLYNSSI